jgi:hypothetical protein
MSGGELAETVQRVVRVLKELGTRFHLTGGIVASYYGQPRMTVDIDVVIALDEAIGPDAVVSTLEHAFDIDSESVRSSLRSHEMFQALDRETYLKVDFHVDARIPGEFDRSAVTQIFPGVTAPIASPEDAILSKLIWYRMGSDRYWQDALYMIRRQGDNLNIHLLTQLA